MTQQTKRAPGRPKSTAAKPAEEKSKAPSVEVKKPPIIRKEKAVENASFVAPKGGIMYMLKGTALVTDKETGQLRRMRYIPDDPSIWVDEQYPGAKAQPIVFRMKNLFVRKDQPNLLKFLELHPQNKANGGSAFYKVEETLNKEKEMQAEFSSHDAISLVRDTPIDDLLPIALYHGVNVDRPVSDIRYDLLQLAKKKPQELIESFDSPVVKARAAVYQAKQYSIISIRDNGCYWHDTNNLIIANPTGQDCMETMTRFCLTEKGSVVLASLNDRLAALA
jgi:hypothetical protein